MTTLAEAARRRRAEAKAGDVRPGGLRRTPVAYVVLIALALYAGLPVLVLLFNSVKSRLELGQNPLGFPQSFEWSNFSTAWEQGHLGQGLINSAILVTSTILGVWVCAGMAAYALARLDVPLRGGIATYLFLVISLPVQLFLVPLFFLWSQVGLVNTLPGLIIIYIATNTPFATLLLRTFIVGIPRELDEAARIDGANEWQTATRVILPLARPGLLTVGLVVGLATYNELLFAVTFISDPSKLPIATAYLSFSQGHTQQFELLNAAGVIMIVPVIVLFLFMQRRFISGLATGGIKG
ncbi:carbohydrate ABC transporter permease [Microbacterium sp.]|uniref:carbohydrate ABC transporter permease n=1 Tax=Microbacterium sp. TaxID=51671 RepID=UPI001ACBEFD0|nr:carbohydrate ABC transporter permease [Microbacterium sp.]MBN9193560.1 carbohydrate ABC transporter permease [Microbacterium sp.]